MKKTLFFMILAAFSANLALGATLTLITPNGGELCLGSRFNITWTATGMRGGVKVKLVLFKGSDKIGTIAQDINADSSPYTWTVGSHDRVAAPADSGYRIRLRTMDNTLEDFDNAPFTIKTCSDTLLMHSPLLMGIPRGIATTVRVTMPNTRIVVTHGDERVIYWEHANARAGQRLKIDLLRYPGGCRNEASMEVVSLGTLPVDANHYIWDVSPVIRPSDSCVIRLSPSVPGDFAPDESDECFILRPRTTVHVLAPNGGENYRRGSPITICWEATNLQPYQRVWVSLLYFDPTCSSWTLRQKLCEPPIESREYSWPGDPTLAAGQYAIEVLVLTGSSPHVSNEAEDRSETCFSIR